jgi:hypothetical protein
LNILLLIDFHCMVPEGNPSYGPLAGSRLIAKLGAWIAPLVQHGRSSCSTLEGDPGLGS